MKKNKKYFFGMIVVVIILIIDSIIYMAFGLRVSIDENPMLSLLLGVLNSLVTAFLIVRMAEEDMVNNNQIRMFKMIKSEIISNENYINSIFNQSCENNLNVSRKLLRIDKIRELDITGLDKSDQLIICQYIELITKHKEIEYVYDQKDLDILKLLTLHISSILDKLKK